MALSRGHCAWHTAIVNERTLRTTAERYRLHEAKAEVTRLELADEIRAAAGEGMRQVDIVKATGYTREQIRRIVAGRTR